VKVSSATGCESVLSDSFNFVPTGIQENSSLNSFVVAPNPYYGKTNILIGLNQSAQVKIEVYNILGSRIQVIENGQLNAGSHNFTFSASALGEANGVYLIRVNVDGKVITKRVIEN
jgi:hypothetical protein